MPTSPRLALLLAPLVSLGAACMSTPAASGQRARAVGGDTFVVPRALTASARGGAATLGGDFDGRTTLVGPDVTAVPDAGGGTGGAFALGYTQEGVAVEIGYERTDFDDLELEAVAFAFAYHFRAHEPLQPYVQLGILVPWATLEDASTDGVRVGDAELEEGFGLRLGVGQAWFLSDAVSLDLRLAYTYYEFGEAEGVLGIEGDIDDPLHAGSLAASVGLTVHLPLRSPRWDR